MTTFVAFNAQGLITDIDAANNDTNEPHYIHLQGTPNDYLLDSSFTPAGSLFGPTAFPVIKRDITIDGKSLTGANANGLAIERTSSTLFRFFGVNAKTGGGPTAKLTLKNIILIGGDSGSAGGGAIVNDGPMILYRCTLRDNRSDNLGGAIYNGDFQRLDIISCIFDGNEVREIVAQAGAIYSSTGSQLLISTTTFRNNAAPKGDAAAIYCNFASPVVIHRSSVAGNTSSVGNSIFNNGPSQLKALCNWWGDPSGAGGMGGGSGDAVNGTHSNNVNTSNPVGYRLDYEEMLYPVFGEARSSLTDADLIPAIVANSFVPGTHEAVDIVPIDGFNAGPTCEDKRTIDDNWDNDYTDYAGTPSTESLKTVYAVTDGTFTAFHQQAQGQPLGTNTCSVPCNAQLQPLSSSFYQGRLFLYAHVVLVPAMNDLEQRSVKAGDPIGYVRNHNQDLNADVPSHLHFASTTTGGSAFDVRRYLVTGLMDTNPQKECRTLCPSDGCCTD